MEGASIIMICPSSDARLNPVYALVTSSRKHFMLSTQIEFLQPPLFWTIDHIYHWSFLIAVKGLRDKIEELCFFFLQRSLWKELSFYLTSDVFEANFGVPWMDVYDSLDVVRQGDLNAAHKVEGQPLLEEKIAPTYGELAAFAHNEQAWHAMRSFPSSTSIIHWFLHLHRGFPILCPCKAFAWFQGSSKMLFRATHSPTAVRHLRGNN